MTVVILSHGTYLKLPIVTTIFFTTTCFARTVFELPILWWRILRLKFGGDPYCKLNDFFHVMPRPYSAFSASAERTPVHRLRRARSATANKPDDCVRCGMGYWNLKTGDFIYEHQYHSKTLFVLSYWFLYHELTFVYLYQFVEIRVGIREHYH
jgi:hypothetical protein